MTATSYKCEICGRCFARGDSLKRHGRLHSATRTPPPSRKKACVSCVKSKLRCSREGSICSNCHRRGIDCIYPEEIASRSTLSSPIDEQNTISPSDQPLTFEESLNYPQLEDFNALHEIRDLDWLFADNLFQGDPSFVDIGSSQANIGILPDPIPVNGFALEPQAVQTESHSDLPMPQPQEEHPDSIDEPLHWKLGPTTPATFHIPPLRTPARISSKLSVMQQATWRRLLRVVDLASTSGPWGRIYTDEFPDALSLSLCLETYFSEFHPRFPIIHKPTFKVDEAAPELLLAMTCIGALYVAEDKELAMSLAELCRRLLWFMSEHDARYLRTLSHVQARFLHSTLAGRCHNQRLFELNEASNSFLINSAVGMNLFERAAYSPNSKELMMVQWKAWIHEESLNQLAWAIIEYDSFSSLILNRRSILSIGAIDIPMPGSEELWEAPTEQTWYRLFYTKPREARPYFRGLLAELFGPEPQEAALKLETHAQQRVMLIMLARMLWTQKELYSAPILFLAPSKAQGIIFSTEIIRDAAELLKDRVVRAHGSVNGITVTPQLGRIHQVYFICQLHAAGDLLDWSHQLLRKARTAHEARQRMQRWAASDPFRVRRTTYHAAQLLSVIRWHRSGAPPEPFNTLTSGIVLWCMSQILNSNVVHKRNDSATRHAKVLQLDHLELTQVPPPTNDLLTTWLTNADPDLPIIPAIDTVPDLTSPNAPLQILQLTARTLDEMKIWTISRNLRSVVLRLMSERAPGSGFG